MKYEKTQKGNPHKLTVKQHVFPAASIARFAGRDGLVQVMDVKSGRVFRVKPKDDLFCVKRQWDQRTEGGLMRQIEDAYQLLAGQVASGATTTISGATQQAVITDMFALWNIRAQIRVKPVHDQSLKPLGVRGVTKSFTKDEQEILETNGIYFIKPDLSIPGRQIAGPGIVLALDKARKQMKNAHWGIVTASQGQFVVPDGCSHHSVLPLTPTICFLSPSDGEVMPAQQVALINMHLIVGSRKYCLANDFSRCPRLGHAIVRDSY
jgi:hypothetical protein